MDKAWDYFPKEVFDRFNVCRSGPIFIDIMPKNVNKGVALINLRSLAGVSKNEVMAIGDAENDQGMLEEAAAGIAMANSAESLKEIAAHITKSNDEAGVAYAIEKWT